MITALAFLPLQGFFNLFVYFLPRWLSSRQASSNKSSRSMRNVNNDCRRSPMLNSSKSSGSHDSKRMSVIRMPTSEQIARWDAEAGESYELQGDSSELQFTLETSKSTLCNSSDGSSRTIPSELHHENNAFFRRTEQTKVSWKSNLITDPTRTIEDHLPNSIAGIQLEGDEPEDEYIVFDESSGVKNEVIEPVDCISEMKADEAC